MNTGSVTAVRTSENCQPRKATSKVSLGILRAEKAPRNVFIYLGAFSALKIPRLTFEVAFLGWQFSLVCTAVTLPVFIFLAYLLERLLPAGMLTPEAQLNEANQQR